jgi:two-component system phosphate regulon sensor histidine kinase PhoR
MNQKKLIPIVIVTVILISLGALITHFKWVMDMMQFRELQFQHKIENQLFEIKKGLVSRPRDASVTPSIIHTETIGERLSRNDFETISSMVKKTFRADDPHIIYEWAVCLKNDGKIVYASRPLGRDRFQTSRYRVDLPAGMLNEPAFLSVVITNEAWLIFRKMILMPLLSGLFLLVLVLSLFVTVKSNLRQKKLIERRADYMDNLTHELKTPISTIAVSAEMLMNPAVSTSAEKIEKYSRIIGSEIERLKNIVEHLLQGAAVVRKKIVLRRDSLDVHYLLTVCLDNFEVLVQRRNGFLTREFNAVNPRIEGDKDYFNNIIHNLLDNANKYSPESPHIRVVTENHPECIRISIEDKGMGISKRDQQRLFRKFHRIRQGLASNIQGTGIGLYYVKKMTEAMGGSVKLNSEPARGTTVELIFPQGENLL